MAKPRCPVCKSTSLELPGHVPFVWVRGKWRPLSEDAMIADGAPIHCGGCSAKLWQNGEGPLVLVVEDESGRWSAHPNNHAIEEGEG